MATAAPSELLPALIADLASAIEAVGGTPVTVSNGSDVAVTGWSIPLTATGALRGTATLTLDGAGVTALLHLVLGPDADTSEGAVRDLLTELTNQAVSSLCLKQPFAKVSLSLGPIEPAAAAPDQTTLFLLMMGDAQLPVAGVALLEPMAELTPPVPTAPAAPRRSSTNATPTLPGNLDVVLDIELPLAVRFGSTVMSIRALSAIGPGSIVDMGRSPDDPVEILVCGRPIARAEVVIVSGNYGVRITDLTSAAERIRAMEGQL